MKAARPVAAPSPTASPSPRPPTLKRTPTPAITPCTTSHKPFPSPTPTATTTAVVPAQPAISQSQAVQLSGVWLLDVKQSDSVVPLYQYHHVPYSALTIDRDQWIMHVEQKSDRLTVHYYILAASFPLSSFTLSSPPPSYSVSYPISSPTAASAFHPVRLPHRSTTARCYPAPHLQSVLIDTCCQSKYDLERREYYMLNGALLEEVRVLSCDPTVPDQGGRKGAGVASPFAKGLEGKEVVALNKTVVKELLMLKRRWVRWDGGKKVASSAVAGEDVKEKGKARLEVKGRDKRKTLSDVKEDGEDDGTDESSSQLLSPPSAAGARGRSPASTPSTSPTVSPSVSPAPPRSRSPSPLPSPAAIRSPSPLPALSSTSLPLPDLTGVYILDKQRSQSLAPLLARHGIRVRRTAQSAAASVRQSKAGMKPSPISLLPATLCEVVRLSCEQSTVTAAYYVCKQWAGLPLSSYPASCFVPVATERFIADGSKRMVYSELHPPVEARCVVKEGAVVTVEAEGDVSGGGRWRETSELKRTADGLELCITRLEAGRQPIVVRRHYQVLSGVVLSAVKEEQKAIKDDKVEVSVARKDSTERDSRAVEDDSAKVIERPLPTKAEQEEATRENDEVPARMDIEQVQPTADRGDEQQTEQTETAADTEAERRGTEEVEEEAPLEHIEEEEEEEAEEEVEESLEPEPTEAVEERPAVELAEEASAEDDHVDVQPVREAAEEEDGEEAEDEEVEDNVEDAQQPLPVAPTTSLSATQQPAAVAGDFIDEKREEKDEAVKEVEAISRSVLAAHRDATLPAADVQQALWRRKDVWFVVVLAIVLLMVWHATSDR